MGKEELLKRREEVSKEFDSAQAKKEANEQELYRLQGEYRILTELIDGIDKEVSKKGAK